MSRFLLASALAALTVAFAGCGGDKQDAPQARAQEEFCASLKDLGADVEALFTLDRDEREAAIDAIDDDWDEVDGAASDLEDVNRAALDDAWDEFTSVLRRDDASFSDQLSATGDFASTVWATYTPNCLGS